MSYLLLVELCPRKESNLHYRFRKPAFYPLNYEDKLNCQIVKWLNCYAWHTNLASDKVPYYFAMHNNLAI